MERLPNSQLLLEIFLQLGSTYIKNRKIHRSLVLLLSFFDCELKLGLGIRSSDAKPELAPRRI